MSVLERQGTRVMDAAEAEAVAAGRMEGEGAFWLGVVEEGEGGREGGRAKVRGWVHPRPREGNKRSRRHMEERVCARVLGKQAGRRVFCCRWIS